MLDERRLAGAHYAAELEDPQVYRQRREKVRSQLDGGVAVLFGASDARGYGESGAFRQEPSFFHLTGVEIPNAVLLLTESDDTLFLPARQPNLEAWFGPRLGPGDDTARRLGFDHVLDREATEIVLEARRRPQPGFADRVAAHVAGGAPLWLAYPSPSAAAALDATQRFAAALRERLPSFVTRDLSPLLHALRIVKSAGEIALLRKAVAATIAGFRDVAPAVRPGAREGELEGIAYAALRREGAEGWSFPPIVGSGFAGTVLHYEANAGTLADGELVVVDMGARYGYYCGDLTRTFPVSGRFTPRQRALYDAVGEAWDAAVATLRPGSTIGAARRAAFAVLERHVDAAGAGLGRFFIHGIGHFLGLETHDVGGDGRPFEPGMVLTIEPGVYLPDEGIGIRTEDDFLITEAGAENLSAALPRDAEAIEAMVLAARA